MLGTGKPGSLHFAFVPLHAVHDGAPSVSTLFCLLVVSSIVLDEASPVQLRHCQEALGKPYTWN